MHNNLDNEEKEHWKKEGTIGGYDNLGDNKKGQLRRKCEKKKRNSCVKTLNKKRIKERGQQEEKRKTVITLEWWKRIS